MNPMDWEQMPFFLAVARTGSLRAAGEELGATHGTVGRHVRALEASYGVQLFNRDRSGLTLTSAGQTLVPIAEDAEGLFLGARRSLQGLDREETGTVRVSLPPPLAHQIMPPIFAAFSEAHPGIDLEIRVTYEFDDIARAETDVSIRVAFEVSEDVVGRRLFPLALGTYASQDYLDRHFDKAGPRGEGLHWIGTKDISYHPNQLQASPFTMAEHRHAVDDYLMQMHLVRAGYGMAILPVYCEMLYPNFARVPGTETAFDRDIWILLHSDLRRTTRVRRVVDFFANALKDMRGLLQGDLAG